MLSLALSVGSERRHRTYHHTERFVVKDDPQTTPMMLN